MNINPINYCTLEAAQRPPTEAELKEFKWMKKGERI